MKKTITISLANFIFHIDEDAYCLLKRYLDDVKNAIYASENRDKILIEKEAQIAELILKEIKNHTEVVHIELVKSIIMPLGVPKDYDVDAETRENEYTLDESTKPQPRKKLYRTPQDKYIGGVFGGLARYFNIDPFVLRLAMLILAFATNGFLIIVYLVFWVLVPLARTKAQKLQMNYGADPNNAKKADNPRGLEAFWETLKTLAMGLVMLTINLSKILAVALLLIVVSLSLIFVGFLIYPTYLLINTNLPIYMRVIVYLGILFAIVAFLSIALWFAFIRKSDDKS